MKSLALLVVGFVGTVFWPASPEAATVLYVADRAGPPIAAALLVFAGQATAVTLLLLFGDRLGGRWRWLDRRWQRVRDRYGARLAQARLPLAVTSGLAGVPAVSLTALLAASAGLGSRRFTCVLLGARLVRFILIATFAVSLRQLVAAHGGHGLLPNLP